MIFPYSPCVCYYDPDRKGCRCGDEEKALRHFSGRTWPHGPMTPEQRAWCIDEADRAGEGSFKREDLEQLTDRDLAADVLRAWTDYVRSNCGL
jgi:hypothetical protein